MSLIPGFPLNIGNILGAISGISSLFGGAGSERRADSAAEAQGRVAALNEKFLRMLMEDPDLWGWVMKQAKTPPSATKEWQTAVAGDIRAGNVSRNKLVQELSKRFGGVLPGLGQNATGGAVQPNSYAIGAMAAFENMLAQKQAQNAFDRYLKEQQLAETAKMRPFSIVTGQIGPYLQNTGSMYMSQAEYQQKRAEEQYRRMAQAASSLGYGRG